MEDCSVGGKVGGEQARDSQEGNAREKNVESVLSRPTYVLISFVCKFK